MNRAINRHWVYFVLIVASVYLLLLSFAIAGRKETAAYLAIIVPFIITVLYLLTFRLHLLALSLALIVPLSVRLQAGGGAMVSFPGELLVLALALFYLLFSLNREKQPLRGILRHPITVMVLLDLGWSAYTGLIGEMPLISLKRLLIKGIFIAVFYFLFSGLFRDRKNIAWIYLLYALGLIIPIIWSLYNHSHYEFSKVVSFLMPLPFYNDHTLYATCIVFVLPVVVLLLLRPNWYSLRAWSKPPLIGLIILMVVGVYFSFSRAAWLSIAAGILAGVLVAFFRFRMNHLIILAGIGAIIVSHYSRELYMRIENVDARSRHEDVGEHMESVLNIQSDASNLERINRWQSALRMFRDKPLTGFGPGTYQFVYAPYQATNEMTRISTNHGEKGNAHSEYLMYLSEMGIPGLLIFLLLIYYALSRSIRIFREAQDKPRKWLSLAILIGLTSYAFHGLFNSFIDTDKAAILFYGSLAAIVALDHRHRH